MISVKAAKKDLARRIFSHGFRCFGRVSFFIFCRVHIIHVGRLPQDRAMILASNHISHFDPLLLGVFFARYVDWMAMQELFRHPLAANILDWLCAFPVTRNGRDRRAMRTALRRLELWRTVGMFPEGGIRAGRSSVVEGAPMWLGAAALSVLSKKPIVPCVIFGSDRLYRWQNWLSLGRIPIWIAFGEPIYPACQSPKELARKAVAESLAQAFLDLKEVVCGCFHLSPADLPSSPQARKREDYLPAAMPPQDHAQPRTGKYSNVQLA
jgi:1-acyl-sn-glycerol-3-phosphate acyltransferase